MGGGALWMDGGIEQPTQALEASKQDFHAGTTTEVVDGVDGVDGGRLTADGCMAASTTPVLNRDPP